MLLRSDRVLSILLLYKHVWFRVDILLSDDVLLCSVGMLPDVVLSDRQL